MDVIAITRNVRIGPRKARDLARAVMGKSIGEALRIIEFSPRKAAGFISKTLKSAMANAQHNYQLDVDKLSIKKCVFDEGSRLRRFWPVARGSAHPIEKQLCHVTVILTDEPRKKRK